MPERLGYPTKNLRAFRLDKENPDCTRFSIADKSYFGKSRQLASRFLKPGRLGAPLAYDFRMGIKRSLGSKLSFDRDGSDPDFL